MKGCESNPDLAPDYTMPPPPLARAMCLCADITPYPRNMLETKEQGKKAAEPSSRQRGTLSSGLLHSLLHVRPPFPRLSLFPRDQDITKSVATVCVLC